MHLDALPEEVDELVEPVYGPYKLVFDRLRPSTSVLDVGCGNAKVSAYLARTGAAVDGIEPTADRASIAADRLRYLSTVPAGQDDAGLADSYDYITFFDVLEHIVEPQILVGWALARLSPGGQVIASIPNSAHHSFRRKMLRGNWRMEDWGLFDRTHLRFFDPSTMDELTPSGAVIREKHYFQPSNRRRSRLMLRAAPRLMALHVVMVWEQSPTTSP